MDLLLQRMGPRAIDRMLTSGAAADRFSADVYVEYGTFEGEVIREAARDVADVLVPYFARTPES